MYDGALHAISKSQGLRSRIRVEELIFYFPADFMSNEGIHISANASLHMEEISSALGARIYTPHYDEKQRLGELELHFIYTPDDCSIFKGCANANVCSLIFTVKGNSKKVMFTGDAFRRSLQMTLWRFGKDLKCDILQMPHHGLCDTGLLDFYRAVNADTLLIPISIAGHRTMHSDMYGNDPAANLWAEANAKIVYNAFEGNTELYI